MSVQTRSVITIGGEMGVSLCRPAKGRSLGATVQSFGVDLRNAVAALAVGYTGAGNGILKVPLANGVNHGIYEPEHTRLSWLSVSVAILHAYALRSSAVSPLETSHKWFVANSTHENTSINSIFERDAISAADSALARVVVSQDLLDLLPYVFEPQGHVTRAQWEQDIRAQHRREQKRKQGVFYTPSDVAEFIVNSLASQAAADCKWLDPACGTGIFLRSCLRLFFGGRVPTTCGSGLAFCYDQLFGIDLSAQATESCAFVLLAECAARGDLTVVSPYIAWRRLAANFVVHDALRICGHQSLRKCGDQQRLDGMEDSVPLETLFPSAAEGFDCVIMNPPYSSIRVDGTLRSVWDSYRAVRTAGEVNSACGFVEMLWRFARVGSGSGAAVMPLSIGTSSTAQFAACRTSLVRAGGKWEFLFFDREPHALFGEDIKTRNAIVFYSAAEQANVYTSGLLKWTSATRRSIFSKRRLVSLRRANIERFIPKFGTSDERDLYGVLEEQRCSTLWSPSMSRMQLTDALAGDIPRLVVGSTAYNFLNVFPGDQVTVGSNDRLSSSPVNVLDFDLDDQRFASYALLTSSLAYWLWHVEGDGFHVTAEFLKRLPIWHLLLKQNTINRLAPIAKREWDIARANQLRSLNGGRVTYSFRCSFDTSEMAEAEHIIFSALELPSGTSRVLEAFVERSTSVGGAARARTPLVTH